jgi:hypothetical protein
MNLTDVHDARPGGSNRQERAHRVGAPKSPAEAIKEIGMVQVRTCVSVHCAQCGGSLGGPSFEEHYPTEGAALDAVTVEGWVEGPGGRWWCSACGPVLTCEAKGHQFTAWRRARIDEVQVLGGDEQGNAREYRYCRRCCLHESRPVAVLVGEVA